MKARYEDIRALTDKEPDWWDDNGTPRFMPFHPGLDPDIYCDEVMLYEISCQDCGQKFLVSRSQSTGTKMNYYLRNKIEPDDMSVVIKNWIKSDEKSPPIHYGDPPVHDCIGDTMNCEDLRIVEFWVKNASTRYNWARLKELEISFDKTS